MSDVYAWVCVCVRDITTLVVKAKETFNQDLHAQQEYFVINSLVHKVSSDNIKRNYSVTTIPTINEQSNLSRGNTS